MYHKIFFLKKPVYLGDTVIAKISVTSVNVIKRRIFFNTICIVNDRIVIDEEAEIYIPKPIHSLEES